jgi:uncharacterized delta-60 repeat protein
MPLKNILKAARAFENLVIFAFLTLLIFTPGITVRAAAGDLDPTFGGSGALKLTNPHILSRILVQADGKILSSGGVSSGSYDNPVYTSYLVRFTANGGYDNGFGAGGFVRPQIGQNFPINFTFTLQPDSKIVVLANVPNSGNYVIRYNSNGLPDSTFGTDGVVSLPPVSWLGVFRILVQPDGKMLICGFTPTTPPSSFDRNYALMRLNPDGTPDASFGNDGIFVPALDLQFYPYAMLLQADNKIIISGTHIGSGSSGFYAARFLANGAVDTSYGTNGKVFTTFGNSLSTVPYDAALQSDGKLVQGGSSSGDAPAPNRIALVRYTTDGQLDASFGTGGKVLHVLNNRTSQVFGIAIQPNGKILVCGNGHDNTQDSRGAMIARFNPSGALDTTFGRGNGFVLTQYPQPSDTDQYYDMALQPDGKIVAAGFSRYNKYSYSAIIARYLNNDATDFDFDGDGKADLAIFRPSAEAEWYWLNSSTSQSSGLQFGGSADKPAPADFDGDGKTDVSLFRPADGGWYRLNSSDNTFTALQFGALGDLPVPGDFDGDTKADICVYRPSVGSWFRINSSNNQFVAAQFGIAEDVPLIGDFDGDGKSDLAVYRPSNGYWYRVNGGSDTFSANQFGISEDKPVAADYDGDGKTDLAVYRPSVGDWYFIYSSTSAFAGTHFGNAEDRPATADFDGDGKSDMAVFRPSGGIWYLLRTSAGFTGIQFGAAGDVPVPNAFIR